MDNAFDGYPEDEFLRNFMRNDGKPYTRPEKVTVVFGDESSLWKDAKFGEPMKRPLFSFPPPEPTF